MVRRHSWCGILVIALLDLALAGPAFGQVRSGGWSYFGGDHHFTRYAPLSQIDASNVSRLEIAWRRPAVDPQFSAEHPDTRVNDNFRSTPIYVEGVLYAPNGVGLVEAFDPATGRMIWRQEVPESDLFGVSTRGVEYWSDGSDRRILSIRGEYLHVLDARTGRPVESFGEGGRLLLSPEGSRFSWTSGPLVANDVIVIAGNVDGAGDGGMWWKDAVSEDVHGFDVRTGERLWTFHPVPHEGEFGTETWGNESWRESGDLGSWCCMSADEELGYVYIPFTAPTSAYYGAHRPGANLFSNSLVALDLQTGERVWHFQMVHHDLWEYDTVGPATLGTVTVDGRERDIVMQPAKTGWVYVFDRATGEPIWPIEERPVPTSRVPGEYTSPTQPFPTRPPAFSRQNVTVDDLIDFTPELERRALEIADSFNLGGIFSPPGLLDENGRGGTYSLPGSWGAGNWNTGAFDPETGYYYAVSHVYPRVYRITVADEPDTEMDYWSPDREAPGIEGIPIVKPPWGEVTAIDMNRGEIVWKAANGPGPKNHPLLAGLDLGDLGTPSRSAPLLTRSLLFLSEGNDATGSPAMAKPPEGRAFRAYDKATGDVLWQTMLGAGATGAPISYMHRGKQYVLVAIGDREHGAEWVAFSLP